MPPDRMAMISELAASREVKKITVINTNSGRFHLPECQSVQDMKEKNRKEFFGTREELVDAGYKPCGRCNP